MDWKKIIRLRSLGLAVVLTVTTLVAVSGHSAPALAASGNLLTNADMESGTTGWSSFGLIWKLSRQPPVTGFL